MPDSQPAEEFRTWLKQRIDAGEEVSLTTSSQDSGAEPEAPPSARIDKAAIATGIVPPD